MKKEAYGSSRLLPQDIARRTCVMFGRFSYKDLFASQPDGTVFESGELEVEGIQYYTQNCSRLIGRGVRPSITIYTVNSRRLWEYGGMPERIFTVAHRLEGQDNGDAVTIEAREYAYVYSFSSFDGQEVQQVGTQSEVVIFRSGMVFNVDSLPKSERKRISRLFKIK